MKNKLKIGILYPLYSAEDDYPRLAAALEPTVEVQVIHTDSPNLHRIDESLITGSREYLLAGAEELRPHNVAVCLWACTSASFAFGVEGGAASSTRSGRCARRAGVKYIVSVPQC